MTDSFKSRKDAKACLDRFLTQSLENHPMRQENDNYQLPDFGVTESLFDFVPDVVFFVKDLQGRYARVNQTLADRCVNGDKTRMIGKLPSEVFPPALAVSYTRQDSLVLKLGHRVTQQLELHIYPGGERGWCLTTKYPLQSMETRRIIGITGISRDLNAPCDRVTGFEELASAIEYLQSHFAEPICIEQVARNAGFSMYQFEQRVRKLFHMSPVQLLHKFRLDEAARLLKNTELTLRDIAVRTGWCDQSAFTRHFNRYAGLPPGKFRSFERSMGS
jgi:AraC-like DNA-binding protein